MACRCNNIGVLFAKLHAQRNYNICRRNNTLSSERNDMWSVHTARLIVQEGEFEGLRRIAAIFFCEMIILLFILILLRYKNKFNGSKTIHLWVQEAKTQQSHLVSSLSIKAIHSTSMTVSTIPPLSLGLADLPLMKELIKFITPRKRIISLIIFRLHKASSKPNSSLMKGRDKFLHLPSTKEKK